MKPAALAGLALLAVGSRVLGAPDGRRLTVADARLVDASGREVTLRGVNARVQGLFDVTFGDGRLPLEPIPIFDAGDADRLRAFGFNLLRLPIRGRHGTLRRAYARAPRSGHDRPPLRRLAGRAPARARPARLAGREHPRLEGNRRAADCGAVDARVLSIAVAAELDRPGFLWDVRLTEPEFRELLARGTDEERRWAIRRLLEYGEWEEIWRCLTLADVERVLPSLRFRSPEVESFWQEALARWRARAA